MPWTPAQAKQKYKGLTTKQADLWSKVANASLAAGDDDGTAIKKANGAVNRMRKAESYTEAAVLLTEIGRSISAANGKQIKAALKAMQDAMEVIAPLIDNEEEEVAEESYTRFEEASKILAQDDSYDSVRYAVQHALRKRAISDALTQKVADGSYADYYDYGCMPYIRDLYDGYVVYSLDSELYQCEYTLSDDSVELGDPTEVKVSYVPLVGDTSGGNSDSTSNSSSEKRTVDLDGPLTLLQEKAVRDDGTARVKLISPGWGSSGYYGANVLERDGPKAFTKGMHMYMNHPTEEEDRNRPERDLKDLVGVIASDVMWEKQSDTNTGDGLYADVKVFSPYRSFVDEAAPYIGTSIRAAGKAIEGEADGRHGLLIDELSEGYSVDYVTLPGRGGEILSLYESARNRATANNVSVELELHEVTNSSVQPAIEVEGFTVDITQEELNQLKEAATNASAFAAQLEASNKVIEGLRQSLVLSEARNLITETLATIEMPSVVREKLRVECARTVPMADGALDRAALTESVKAAAVAEMQYIESVTGSVTGGKVTGITAPASKELVAEEVTANLDAAFRDWGLSENGSKIAAAGRQ